MLLDTVKISSADDLNNTLKLMFDSTATGLEQVSLEQIAETHLAIGIELSALLMREYDSDPQKAWQAVLSILRCLPWRVDPEKAYVNSNEGVINAIYRYFGGLEWTDLDPLFSKLRDMADEGKPWQDIVEYACEELQSKV